jgi:aconitate hydratase
MALLQFMHAGKSKVAVPNSALRSLEAKVNGHRFARAKTQSNGLNSSVSNKYGIGFWKPSRNYSSGC